MKLREEIRGGRSLFLGKLDIQVGHKISSAEISLDSGKSWEAFINRFQKFVRYQDGFF